MMNTMIWIIFGVLALQGYAIGRIYDMVTDMHHNLRMMRTILDRLNK